MQVLWVVRVVRVVLVVRVVRLVRVVREVRVALVARVVKPCNGITLPDLPQYYISWGLLLPKGAAEVFWKYTGCYAVGDVGDF